MLEITNNVESLVISCIISDESSVGLSTAFVMTWNRQSTVVSYILTFVSNAIPLDFTKIVQFYADSADARSPSNSRNIRDKVKILSHFVVDVNEVDIKKKFRRSVWTKWKLLTYNLLSSPNNFKSTCLLSPACILEKFESVYLYTTPFRELTRAATTCVHVMYILHSLHLSSLSLQVFARCVAWHSNR